MKEYLVVEEIKKDLISKFKKEFGYAGLTDSGDEFVLNSGNDKNILVKIEIKD